MVVTALTLLSTRRMPPQVFRAAVSVRQHGPLLFKMSSGCWGCLNPDFDVSVDNHGRGIMRVFKCIQRPERKALDCRRKWYLAAHRLSILFCPSVYCCEHRDGGCCVSTQEAEDGTARGCQSFMKGENGLGLISITSCQIHPEDGESSISSPVPILCFLCV